MNIISYIYLLIRKNITIKLMAIFLTTIIWFIIQSSKQVQAKKFVHVNYITPTGYTVSEAPKEIELTLRGPKGFINEILSKEKTINIDLRNKKTGFVSYKLSRDIITLPINVEILKISPKELMPKLEELVSKDLPIEASLVGNLKEGYSLGSIKVTPATIKVSAAKSYITQIKKLVTKPINITEFKEAISLETLIDPKHIKNIPSLKEKLISVYLEITPIVNSKIYRDIPILVKGINKRHYKINPKSVDVVIKGPEILLDKLQDIDIKASIDITFNKKGSFNEDIYVETPENLSITSINPRKISVWIY